MLKYEKKKAKSFPLPDVRGQISFSQLPITRKDWEAIIHPGKQFLVY